MKPFKLPEIITEEEFIKIMEKTKKPGHKLAFALGFYEGMRISEIVNLKPEDINRQLKTIHIKQGKGHKDRVIPIAPEVMRGLSHLPIKIGCRALQKAFKGISKEAIGKDIHFHTLRHSAATHYLTKKKWSSLEVQRLLGHSKITTTEIYSHVSPQALVDRMWEEK